MRLLCVSPFDPEAPTVINRTLPLLQELAKNNCNVDVVLPARSGDSFYRRFNNLNYIFLNPYEPHSKPSCLTGAVTRSFRFLAHPSIGKIFYPLGGFNDLPLALRAKGRIDNNGHECVYISKPWLRAAGLGVSLARKWRIPAILDLDDYDIWHGSYLLKNFQGITVASRELGKMFQRYNTSYIPNSTDLDFFDPKKYTPKKSKSCLVIWSGTMYKSLRLETTLNAFKLVKENTHFTFMGRGANKETLQSYSQTLGLKRRVTFRKWTDRASVPASLSQADIGIIYTSDTLYERCKCPGKLFEYMAMQLPIVATNVGESAHVISEAGCGVLVPPENPLAMAEAIDFLVQNPEERHQMGEMGRKYLLSNQNFSILGARLGEFVKDVVGNWTRKAK